MSHYRPSFVVRTTQDDFAVRIDDTIEARKAMIRQVSDLHDGSASNLAISAWRPRPTTPAQAAFQGWHSVIARP
jgi:hypothetical protein